MRISFPTRVGAFESLWGCFSRSLDPILPLLVSSWECLEINASLSISWTTPCCMVLVSSCCPLSLAHFLPRALDSLFFLSWHILSVCCHFLLDVLGYANWSCSHFYILHLSWAWYFIFWSICLILFSTRYFHYRKVKDMFSHSHHFLEIRLYHLIIFLYGAWVKSESWIFYYKWSIDLMIVLFFTPHSFSGLLIKII